LTVISGAKAGFWAPHAEAVSVAATAEAMTIVGATLEYYITNRAKCWWDPNLAVVVKDAGSPIIPSRVDHAGGYVTLQAAPAGAVTVDVYYFALEALGGAYGIDATLKADTQDVTVFSPTLNSAAAWREFTATLKGWTMDVKRHFFYAKASYTTALGANKDLKWEWRDPGIAGNAEAIVYSADGAPSVVRVANVTTVTYTPDVTTVANVKSLAEAAYPLLFELSYPVADWTAGYHTGGANPSIDIHLLTSPSFNIKADNEAAASLITLNPTGLNSGAAIAAAMQAAIRALGGAYTSITVTYEGVPNTDYYLITSGTTGATSAITITNATSNNCADDLKIGVANGGASTAGTDGSGSGVVGAVTHTHLSGGRDSAEIAKMGVKCLCVMYLNIITGSIAKLEGIGVMKGMTPDCALEALVESDISFEGTGALRFHAI